MKSLLEQERRVLLVGGTAAGKTVLAIALAKRFQEIEQYKVFYLDITEGQAIDGRVWYQSMHTNDHQGRLYILDNCHLAPEEVSTFCAYWEDEPLQYAQCVLISRSYAEESRDSFINRWDDVSIEVQPEELFRSVLEKYAMAYRREDPDRYVALQEDDELALREQHAHNLVMSRIRLEAWYGSGGRLSELTQEMVYQSLCKKYLEKLDRIRNALLTLCALWQYEIPTHNCFVERGRLSEDEVRQLEKEKLLSRSFVPDYGIFYQLLLHPIEAREIFRAGISRKFGHIKDKLLLKEIVQELRAYLLREPSNYSQVYYRLSYQQQTNPLHILSNGRSLQQTNPLVELLKDYDLQICARNEFGNGQIANVATYLRILADFDSSRAQQLLHEFVQQSTVRGIRLQMLEDSLVHMAWFLTCIERIDAQIAQEIVAGMDMEQITLRAQEEQRMHQLDWMIRKMKRISPPQAKTLLESISPSMLFKEVADGDPQQVRKILGYLSGQDIRLTQEVVEAIDMKQLAARVSTLGMLRLYWLVRDVKRASPAQARMLLGHMSASVLATMMTNGHPAPVVNMLSFLHELEIPSRQAIIEAIDMKQLAARASTLKITYFSLLVDKMKRRTSPAQVKVFLEHIPAPILAKIMMNGQLRSTQRMLSLLHGLEIPSTQEVIEAVDMKELALCAQTLNAQRLFWFVREVKKVSPAQARVFLEHIPASALATMATNGYPGLVKKILGFLHELEIPPTQEMVEAIEKRAVPAQRKGPLEQILTEPIDTPEERTAFIDAIAELFIADPQAVSVRQVYRALASHKEIPDQLVALIDAIAAWLTTHPQDTHVRQVYLELVDYTGTFQQSVAAIDATARWLIANCEDADVRQVYLGLVKRKGAAEHVAAVIDASVTWLSAHPGDTSVRATYLRLVNYRGTPAQRGAAIHATAKWLSTNPGNATLRKAYLRLVHGKFP